MKAHARSAAGFSLVEVTLALGVAAFCLITVFGLMAVGLKTQQASVQQTKANAIVSVVADQLRAAVRLPPGLAAKLNSSDPQQNETQTLNSHWLAIGSPDWLYFNNDGIQTGGVSPSPAPVDATFVATITYLRPPTQTTSLADIKISWPAAAVDPTTGTGTAAGSVETFVATNR